MRLRLPRHIPTALFGLAFCACSGRAQGIITTVAGGTWIFRGEGGPATSAPLGNIAGVAADSALNVYAVDSQNDLVVKISPAGTLTVVAGNGIRGFSGDGGPGSSAALFSPGAVAVDAQGAVYISDTLNHRIRKVSGGTITTVAGAGLPGFSGDGGPAINARLNAPGGIALDRSGALYIADTFNHRIRRVSPDGTIGTVAVSLNSPRGVAVDSRGDVFIADWGSHRIRKVTADGAISTVAGTGTQGYNGMAGRPSTPA